MQSHRPKAEAKSINALPPAGSGIVAERLGKLIFVVEIHLHRTPFVCNAGSCLPQG